MSVRESVESVIWILGHRLQDKVELVVEFGAPDVSECYPSLLNQALMKLIANAIDAVAVVDGDTVTSSTGAAETSYVIAVSDTGVGVPEGIRD